MAAGGTAPYVYAWDNGETAPTAILLNAGTHTVTVTDANGCVTTCTVLISENPVLSCAIAVSQAILCNGGFGTLVVTAAGGDGAYEYSLNGGAFQSVSMTYAGLLAGTYTITVRDGNGCVSTCAATLTEPTALACSTCLLYTSPSPRDATLSRMPSSA